MIQPASSGTGRTIHGPKILIVGDTPMIRSNVQIPLQQYQMDTILTSDALHALTLIADERPSLVLLNEKFPHLDGYHICQILRKNLHFLDLPIIMLREKEKIFDRMRGRHAGVTTYITLPMNTKEFVQIVENYLNAQNRKE